MKKKIQIFIISFLILFLVLGLCYIGLAIYYENGFSYDTYINGVYCTGKSVEEINTELCENYAWPGLTIALLDGEEHIDGEDISFTFDFTKPLSVYRDRQNPFLWIENIFRGSEEITIVPTGSYDAEKLQQICNKITREHQTQPGPVLLKNGAQGYVLEDHKQNILYKEILLTMVQNALSSGDCNLNVMEQGGYESAAYTQDEEVLLTVYSAIKPFLDKQITIHFGCENYTFSRTELSNVLQTDGNKLPVLQDGIPVIDKELTEKMLEKAYQDYNTWQNHNFITHTGECITVTGGNYGNKIDFKKELSWFLTAASSEKSEITHEPEYIQKALYQEKNDIGTTYIEIDMTAQQMFYYEEGELILTTDVVTGNTSRKRGTPQMVCSVYGKQKNRVLKGPGYASFVNFWLPVSGNIGIHDAPWRDEFGGNIYEKSGSHGCINTPYDNMVILYDKVEIGTPVVIYYQNSTE